MQPILITIGKINIFSWGLMLAIAVIIAIVGISRLFAREGYKKDMVFDLVILCVIFGIIGGRLAYIFTYEWDAFLANPGSLFSLGKGIQGLAWYGGLIGGLMPFTIYLYRKNLPFWRVIDMFAPYLALGYAIVRVGCFLNGCCYGNITDTPLGVVFPFVDTFPRHPTQLYSSVLNLLLFFVLIRFYPRRKFPGQVFLLYIIGYAIYRFVVEFFRASEVFVGPLSLGQVYTLVLLLVALLVYYWRKSHCQELYISRRYNRI
ncbi:MAG: prolipoprotein diacylglyceryl transferase [Syntrophomonadaceae bacterium]